MLSDNLQKLFGELYPSSINKENENEENASQQIQDNEIKSKNKDIPKELPQCTVPFKTSEEYQIYSEEKSLYNLYFEEVNGQIKVTHMKKYFL